MRRSDEACIVRLYVVPSTKKDRVIRSLVEEGYSAGPNPSDDFMLAEGDRLEIGFRGNIQCVDTQPVLKAIFTTNIDTVFNMEVEPFGINFVRKM